MISKYVSSFAFSFAECHLVVPPGADVGTHLDTGRSRSIVRDELSMSKLADKAVLISWTHFVRRFTAYCRFTGKPEITRLVARHKMFFGSSKRVRCGLPTNRPERWIGWCLASTS